VSIKVVFIGCVDFSRDMLLHAIGLENIEITGVVTRAESRFNADFAELKPVADAHAIDSLIVSGNDQKEMARWIEQRNPDVIFCLGWSYLLRTEILKIPRFGVLGFHPARLPRNRGRHPIIWALALGLRETASTFFIMDEGADSGDIVNQMTVAISPDDDAASLYTKITETAKFQLTAVAGRLNDGGFKTVPQNEADATSWRKRSEKDGEIDWRMSAKGIYDLVRALTRPYVGAHCVVLGEKTKVWKVEPIPVNDFDVEPGKVIDVAGNNVTVKCRDGAVILIDHDLSTMPAKGTYL